MAWGSPLGTQGDEFSATVDGTGRGQNTGKNPCCGCQNDPVQCLLCKLWDTPGNRLGLWGRTWHH